MIERLNGEEQLMLDASQRWPQDIGAVVVLDGGALLDAGGRFRLDLVRQVIASRLHMVPRLRQVLRVPRPGGGAPFWADAPRFDLARHVRELRLEAPAGERELLEAIEQLRAARLDAARPLWAITFLTGLPDSQIVMFVKIHHTVADGMAAMAIVSTFLDRLPTTMHPHPQPWIPTKPPRPSQLVADNLRRRVRSVLGATSHLAHPLRLVRGVLATWPAWRELLAEEPGAKTSLDLLVGEGRRLALVRGSYQAVRRVARAHGASVNDVLLSVTAAGLRGLLISRGEPVEGVVLRVYVPVSLRRSLRGPQQGTNVAQMAVPLSLGSATPADRLRQVARETSNRKARPRPPLDKLFRGRLATRLLLKLVVAQRVNVTTASIPGSRRPAYLAGARLLDVYPILPLLGNQPLGIGAVSSADAFDIGITADRDAFPDIGVLVDCVRRELAAIESLALAEPRPAPAVA